MPDEIDLRDYIDVLIRRWQLILAMPVLAIIISTLVTIATRPTYEATAVIALAPATLSIPTANQVPPYYLVVNSPHQLPNAYTPSFYIALLKSAEVVAQVEPQLPVTLAPNGSDKSMLELTARGEDPVKVASTANKWMQEGAARIQNAILPSQNELGAAQIRLDQAEQALIKFSRDNGLGDYDLNRLRTVASLPADKKQELSKLLQARDNVQAVYDDFAQDWERQYILATSAYLPQRIAASVPTTPISPKPLQNLLVGASFGLLLGILSAFVVEYVAHRPSTGR